MSIIIGCQELKLILSHVQRRRYRRANLTLWRTGSIIPSGTILCGGGRPTVRAQSCQLPAGDGVAAVVHCGMLPRPRQHLDNREYRCRSQGAAPGRQTAGGERFQH